MSFLPFQYLRHVGYVVNDCVQINALRGDLDPTTSGPSLPNTCPPTRRNDPPASVSDIDIQYNHIRTSLAKRKLTACRRIVQYLNPHRLIFVGHLGRRLCLVYRNNGASYYAFVAPRFVKAGRVGLTLVVRDPPTCWCGQRF